MSVLMGMTGPAFVTLFVCVGVVLAASVHLGMRWFCPGWFVDRE